MGSKNILITTEQRGYITVCIKPTEQLLPDSDTDYKKMCRGTHPYSPCAILHTTNMRSETLKGHELWIT